MDKDEGSPNFIAPEHGTGKVREYRDLEDRVDRVLLPPSRLINARKERKRKRRAGYIKQNTKYARQWLGKHGIRVAIYGSLLATITIFACNGLRTNSSPVNNLSQSAIDSLCAADPGYVSIDGQPIATMPEIYCR